MRYVVGYVQRKARKKFPGLTIPDGEFDKTKWIENLSLGGLTIPCSAFISLCQKIDDQFSKFHGEKICKEPNPIERLLEKVLNGVPRSNVLTYICELYIKVRFFNRIKYLNILQKTNESSEKIRKFKQTAQHLF